MLRYFMPVLPNLLQKETKLIDKASYSILTCKPPEV